MPRWYQPLRRGWRSGRPAPAPAVALLAAALALGCAAAGTPAPPATATPIAGRVGDVAVAFAPAAAAGLAPASAERAAALVRQSARDWLEQAGVLAPEGELAVTVTLESLRLRGALGAWLFAWALPPDHLAARVAVGRAGRPAADEPIRVESALSGYGWRDPEERLDRLARRLGRRLAAGFEPAL